MAGSKSLLGAVAEWLGGCPVLKGDSISVGWLPDAPPLGKVCFSVEAVQGGGVERQYLGASGCLRRMPFLLRCVAGYGPDSGQNDRLGGLLETLNQWMDEETAAGRLPELPEDMVAVATEAEDCGQRSFASAGNGIYQMPCALIYLQKGRTEHE